MTVEHPEPQPNQPSQPAPRDMVMLQTPSGVQISPDGARVAFTVSTANWKDNRYESICYLHDPASGEQHPLNRDGSIGQVEWVDSSSLALLKSGPGDKKAQVYLYEGPVGEGWVVTEHKTGVEWFKPFAEGFIYLARNPEREEKKERCGLFGEYVAFEQEESPSALYYIGLEEARQYQAARKARTEDEAKDLVAPVIELSQLFDRPLSIRVVAPSPAMHCILPVQNGTTLFFTAIPPATQSS